MSKRCVTLTGSALTGAVLLAMVAGGALAQTIEGGYAMSGVGLTGSAYSGTTTITRTGETFAIEQNTGGGILEGTGLMRGDSLAAVFIANGQSFVALYDRQPDGTLIGEWTSFAGVTIGTETLTPLGGGASSK